jgi:hypothetical protein
MHAAPTHSTPDLREACVACQADGLGSFILYGSDHLKGLCRGAAGVQGVKGEGKTCSIPKLNFVH